MAVDLSLSESAGSRSLDRLLGRLQSDVTVCDLSGVINRDHHIEFGRRGKLRNENCPPAFRAAPRSLKLCIRPTLICGEELPCGRNDPRLVCAEV